jgi:hypothetical protein
LHDYPSNEKGALMVKRAFRGFSIFVALYAVVWIGGDHGMTYYISPATQKEVTKWRCPEPQNDDGTCPVEPVMQTNMEWTCPPGQDGPLTGEWKNQETCHDPARQCPLLWFPFITETPCRY